MPFVGVLHHHDLKLPGQADHRGAGQEQGRDPAAFEAVRQREHVLQPVIGDGAVEQVAHAVMQAVDSKQADGDEGEQLDDRLKRDRGDDTGMAFARADMAGAEQDDEGPHRNGDPKRRIRQQAAFRARRDGGNLGHDQHVEAGRHRL